MASYSSSWSTWGTETPCLDDERRAIGPVQDEIKVVTPTLNPAARIDALARQWPKHSVCRVRRVIEEPGKAVAMEQLTLPAHEPTKGVALDPLGNCGKVY